VPETVLAAKVISITCYTLNGPLFCATLVFASVTGSPCNVSFVVTFKTTLETSAVATVIGHHLLQVMDSELQLSLAVSQLLDLPQIHTIGMLLYKFQKLCLLLLLNYRQHLHLKVHWCYITISCCNEYPFKVSFDVTFCTVTGVVADAIVVGPSFTASIGFKTTTM
jgi:hypothetical protein